MDWIGLLVVAAVIAAVIILVARRWAGDRPGDRGPFSTAMDARGDFAAFGTTLEPPPDAPEGSPEATDRPDR